MRIAVAGGTGVIGRHVVDLLAADGHEPVVVARARGVNVVTGVGLDTALIGVEVVIDVSNVATVRRSTSVAFFTAGTQQLLTAGRRAGVGHHVVLSIVGVDRVDYGYYEGKRQQEQLALAGPLPASVLRATQFYEFPGQILAQIPGPLAPVPRMRIQPIAAREVAARLTSIAVGPPVGLAPELAGPQEHQLVNLARRLVDARRQHRLVIPVRLPGAVGRDMIAGGLLPQASGPRGVQTFDQWLADSTENTASGNGHPR